MTTVEYDFDGTHYIEIVEDAYLNDFVTILVNNGVKAETIRYGVTAV